MEEKIKLYLEYKLQKKLIQDSIKDLDKENKEIREEVEDYFQRENMKKYSIDNLGTVKTYNLRKLDVDKIINEIIDINFIPERILDSIKDIKTYPLKFTEKVQEVDEEKGEIIETIKEENTLNYILNRLKREYNALYSEYEAKINEIIDKYSTNSPNFRFFTV